MPYLPLPNFNYDSGPRRIQSGPNHEGYIVLSSGVDSTGADNGFIVDGSPLSGNLVDGAWGYDNNWRYVPSTLLNISGSLDPTPYNASGALDTYNGTRIYTHIDAAGAQVSSAIGPEFGRVTPRGAPLQPRTGVTRPEKYIYYGGNAPDNQNYSPFNTPGSNTAAEGTTGGGVTHGIYEGTALTNSLGSQGTSDRSQWVYHAPVYCKTYTETLRSRTPGLMSSPLRYVYRGSSTSYSYNYGSHLLSEKGGFDQLFDDNRASVVPGSGSLLFPTPLYIGSSVAVTPTFEGALVSWYRVLPSTGARTLVADNTLTYYPTLNDENYYITADVSYPDKFSPTGYGPPGNLGNSTLVQFNQYQYSYVRYSGVWYNSTSDYSTVTPWLGLKNASGYPANAITVTNASSCAGPFVFIQPCPPVGGIWSNNINLRLFCDGVQCGSSTNFTLRVYRSQPDGSSPDFFGWAYGGISASASISQANLGTTAFYAAMSGIYEFSNNQSTVIARWNGRNLAGR
jgi:hypothetical protein